MKKVEKMNQLLVIAAGVILFSQAFVQVSAKEASASPPVITVSGLVDGTVVSSPNVNFTAAAEGDAEGNLPVTVTLNGSPVEGQAENYALTLSEGQNTIVITAADSDGTLKSIAGKNGLAVTKDTTKWMFSLNGIAQTNSDEDNTVINSSTAISLGKVNLGPITLKITYLGIYAYDSITTEAYFNFQNCNQISKVGSKVYNYLNRSQKLLNNDVDIIALKDTITPIVFKEDCTLADPSDYILETETLSGTTGGLKITFSSPGVY